MLALTLLAVDRDLLSVLENTPEGKRIGILVYLREQPDYGRFLRVRRYGDVKAFFKGVKDLARRTQKPLLSYLKTLGVEDYTTLWIVNAVALRATPEQVKAISKHPSVGVVRLDREIKLLDGFEGGEGGEVKGVSWGVGRIKADSVWVNLGYTGDGVILGSMDSGVMADHPALSGKVLYWYDPRTNSPTPTDEASCYYHGTHTSGTLLGGDGPGPFTEDVGVAPGAGLAMVRIFGTSSCNSSLSVIHMGFQKFVEWKVDSGYNIVAVNNSWGGPESETEFWNDVLAWRVAGIIPVFSIGNDGPLRSTTKAPGNFPTVIGVGATTSADNVAGFSSRGPAPSSPPWSDVEYWSRHDWNFVKPDIGAPGENITSSYGSNSYSGKSGTSMAAPHLTGTIALMFEKNPNLEYEIVYEIILRSADRLGDCYDVPNNGCGWGRLNAYRAVLNTPSPSSVLLIRKGVLTDDLTGDGFPDPGETVEITVWLKNSGGGTAVGVSAFLFTEDTLITVTDASAYYGDIPPKDSVLNTSDPFGITISPSFPVGKRVALYMDVSANGGGFRDTLGFLLEVGKAYDTLIVDTGNVEVHFTVKTAEIGYLRVGDSDIAYRIGLAYGSSTSNLCDSWFGEEDMMFDWGGVTRQPPVFGDENGAAGYSDSGTPSPQGLRLNVEIYAFRDHRPDRVFLKFYLINGSSSPVNGVYAALFADYDLGASHSDDYGSVDTSSRTAFVYDAHTPYRGGVALVDGPLANLSVIENAYTTSNSDGEKWNYMVGALTTPSAGPGDLSLVVSSGPFNLNPGDTQTVTFAVIGEGIPSELSEKAGSKDLRLRIESRRGRLKVNLRGKGPLRVYVYSTSGRLLGAAYGFEDLRAEFPDLSAGVYFVRVQAEYRTVLRKVIVR